MFEIPDNVMYTETPYGDVSTVRGRGGIIADGLYETCVFYPDNSSRVVSQTWDLDVAFEAHADHIYKLLE